MQKMTKFLKKKLNFLGRGRAVILNIAPPSLLHNLDFTNVFKVLSKQLPTPWDYYWFEEKKKMEVMKINGLILYKNYIMKIIQ